MYFSKKHNMMSNCCWISVIFFVNIWVVFSIRMPKFSWNTVPVYWMACNSSGPFNQEAIEYVGKFPMVCVDQGQGAINGSNSTYNKLSQEEKIFEALKQIKQYNSSITTIFYYNSILDWEMYTHLNDVLYASYNTSWHLLDSNNVTVQIHGDSEFPQPPNGMYVFDFIQENVRNTFIQECINMTQSEYIDGCFVDRGGQNSFPKPYNFTQQRLKEFKQGHDEVLVSIQNELNKTNESVAIINNYVIDGVHATMMERFTADQQQIELLMNYSSKGILVQAHAGYTIGCDAGNFTNNLAAFLIGANEYSYFACSKAWKYSPDWNVWHKEYDKPLGKPLGDAILNNNVYERRFALGTNVTFNIKTNQGEIQWG